MAKVERQQGPQHHTHWVSSSISRIETCIGVRSSVPVRSFIQKLRFFVRIFEIYRLVFLEAMLATNHDILLALLLACEPNVSWFSHASYPLTMAISNARTKKHPSLDEFSEAHLEVSEYPQPVSNHSWSAACCPRPKLVLADKTTGDTT